MWMKRWHDQYPTVLEHKIDKGKQEEKTGKNILFSASVEHHRAMSDFLALGVSTLKVRLERHSEC